MQAMPTCRFFVAYVAKTRSTQTVGEEVPEGNETLHKTRPLVVSNSGVVDADAVCAEACHPDHSAVAGAALISPILSMLASQREQATATKAAVRAIAHVMTGSG
jgi:hypothetical protein